MSVYARSSGAAANGEHPKGNWLGHQGSTQAHLEWA